MNVADPTKNLTESFAVLCDGVSVWTETQSQGAVTLSVKVLVGSATFIQHAHFKDEQI